MFFPTGITGNVQLDNNGDRNPDYWVWDLAPGEDTFKVALEVRMTPKTNQVHTFSAISIIKFAIFELFIKVKSSIGMHV